MPIITQILICCRKNLVFLRNLNVLRYRRKTMKLCYVRLQTCVILAVTMVYEIESQRPAFREDYRYEKKFKAFYKLHKTARRWQDARIICRAEGAWLMVPQTIDEAELIPLLSAPILHKFNGSYVGIHSLYNQYIFVTEQGNVIESTFLDLLWDQDEPRYVSGKCVGAYRNGRFFTRPCFKLLPFICKVMEKNVKYYKECDTYEPMWKLLPGYNECYFVHPDPRTWDMAYATCQAAGGNLYVQRDQKQHKAVADFIEKIKFSSLPIVNHLFTGMSDHFQPHHYRDIYGKRVEQINYAFWYRGKFLPRKNSTITSCGGMDKLFTNFTTKCNINTYFLCEKTVIKQRSSKRTNSEVRA